MTTTTSTTFSERKPPSFGGFNLTFLRLEIRRTLRNRRTLFFTLFLPPILFLFFGNAGNYRTQSVGRGNVTAYVMVSLALYGALLATTSGGAMVAIERAAGWSRQLRLTPLAPVSYIVIKLVTAMTLGAAPVIIVFVLGSVKGAHMSGPLWIICPLIAWVGSILFAAFGLFMGYLLPSENVMQFLGPLLGILAFAGGVIVPLSQFSHTFQDFAKLAPTYGLSQLVHAPLTNTSVQVTWFVNLFVWLAIFAGGAIWRFRKDTARV